MLKVPFRHQVTELNLQYNLWDVYQSYIWNEEIPLIEQPSKFVIDCSNETWSDWDTYCREVIWWGNKKGAYLYDGPEPAPDPEQIY